MFCFDDGSVHNSVELVIENESNYEMVLVGGSTLYCVKNRDIQALGRQKSRKYAYRIDGKLGKPQLYSPPSVRIKTEVYRYSNGEQVKYLNVERPDATELVYIVPGNPGLCEFYYDFIESLAVKCPNASIVAVSYRGFSPDITNTTPRFWQSFPKLHLLPEQIQHHIDMLGYMLSQRPRIQQVNLLGHSVGSYIAQRVAVHQPRRKAVIGFVGLLAPTVHNIALSEKGKKFVQAQQFGLTPYTAFLLMQVLLFIIPFSEFIVRQAVRTLLRGVRPEIVAVSVALALSSATVFQVVGLAGNEMNSIGDNIEPADISGFWGRQPPTYVLFAQKDHWVNPASREVIFERAWSNPHMVSEVLDFTHAFCLLDSELVATRVAQQLHK